MRARVLRSLTLPLSFALTLLSLAPHSVGAGHRDLTVDFGGRAVPFGASMAGEIGWNQLLWGEKKGPGSFQYGFVRAAARAAGSGFVNRGDVFLTIAPISTLAVDLGGTARLRLVDRFATVECLGLQCKGLVTGTRGRIRGMGGFGPFFLFGATTWERLTPERGTEPFVDEQSAQIGGDPARASSGDIRREQLLLLGYKLDPSWTVGWLHQTAVMLRSRSEQNQDAAFVRWELSPHWALLGGAGVYSSTTYAQGPTAFLRATWVDLESLELN